MPNVFQPSVCIDAVFESVPEPEAIARVAEAGIPAIEFWAWWEKDLDAILRSTRQHSLAIAACCTRFVSLTDATKREAYLQGLSESIEAAKRLDCPTLISQVGDALPGIDRSVQRASLIEGLRRAGELLDGTDIKLVIEPLNDRIDHPGYFLVFSNEAFDIIDAVQHENIQVVFDLYHQQISEGHITRRAVERISDIGHFHAAGNPGRHDLQVGELNYRNIFADLAGTGYSGYVGLEYWPVGDPMERLHEVASWFPF
ncbi:MAG: TIM barrel protein [Planctomycetota bacterium]